MKLSVAMVTYNHERFIAEAIESVLAQDVNFDYEIVIGEDCSTDGTRVVIQKFQQRYPERIVVLWRERNIGAMPNAAGTFAACHGQYVAVLQGDDYWTSKDKLQKQVNFLDAHPDWAICCSRAQVKNESSMPSSSVRVQTGTIYPARPGSTASNEQDVSGLLPVLPRAAGTYTLKDLLEGNFIPTCTVMYRWEGSGPRFPVWLSRSKIGDLPRHAIVVGSKKIELFDECTATYRIHEQGVWSSKDRGSQFREHTHTLAALNRYLGFPFNNLLGPRVARSYLDLAAAARSERNRARTGQYLLSCIRNGGLRLGVNPRIFLGLAAYTLIGSGYRVFSRAKTANNG
jgi:glycosyltransferase involved in cell wall biosynthesis